MKLEQHIYTSGKTEFTTVAVTEGISRDERIKLENHSIYFLPVSLHYQENITTPVKYICYPLNEERFVVGKAVYIGKDSLGRTGNYLFHNVIISKEDLMISCRFNPVKLITRLEAERVFRNEVTEQPVEVLEFSSDELQKPTASAQSIPRDLLLQVLYVCIHHELVHQPLLLLGTEKECLAFLDWLYTILPFHVREELCVDTYAYGISLRFQIIGSLEEEGFRQGLTSSFTLHLVNFQYTSHFEMPEPSKHLSFITDMAVTERIDELNAVYSLEYCLRRENYERFKQEYRAISPELQEVIWDFHEDTILNHITAEQDTELLLMIQDKLRVENIDTLYLAPEMIHHLIETGDRKNMELVANWLCTEGGKTLFYPFLFKSHPLWKVFLERIRSRPQDVGFLLEPVKAFQGYYTKEFEETLLEEMLTFLSYIKEERRLAKEFFKAFDAMPQMGTHLHLLRTFIKYELSNNSDLLEHLIDSDLSVLTEQQRTMVLDSILDTILIIKSFKIWTPDKTEQQLRRLFEKAIENKASFLTLIGSLEKLKLPPKPREVLKKVWTEFLERLPDDETSKQITQRVKRLLEPPPSLFKKIENIIGKKFWK